MSKRSNAELSFATDVETLFRRMSILYRGNHPSSVDRETIVLSMSIHTCIVYDALLTVHMDNPRRYLFSILKDITEFDVFTFCASCERLDAVLCEGIGIESFYTFIRRVEDDYCRRLIGGLVAHNVPLMPTIHQVLTFMKRINITDHGCETETRNSFLENLKRVELFNEFGIASSEESDILVRWLDSYQPPSIDDCKFGSGRTADPTIQSLGEKYSNMYNTERTYYFSVRNGLPLFDYSFKGPTYSRCKFVPKSYKSYRTIAMEPHQLMFYQQGVMRSLDRLFQRELRRRIDLHDQSRNRRLAQLGSRDGRYATIDLSSASDSVSLRLVRQWFKRTKCYKDIMTLRSGKMLLDDNLINVPWYAGMGSALCFPIECLVFAAQCEATIRAAGVDPTYSHYCVYGDDIVIESEFAIPLIERLQRNGFLPNREKSFFGGPFREACGGEYFYGEDVTSLKIGRKFTSNLATPNSYSCLISMANSCFSRGLWVTRKYIISLLKRVEDLYLPWTNDVKVLHDDEISSARLYTPTEYSETSTYSPLLQRGVTIRLSVGNQHLPDTTSEAGRLLAALHKPESYSLGPNYVEWVQTRRAEAPSVRRTKPVFACAID